MVVQSLICPVISLCLSNCNRKKEKWEFQKHIQQVYAWLSLPQGAWGSWSWMFLKWCVFLFSTFKLHCISVGVLADDVWKQSCLWNTPEGRESIRQVDIQQEDEDKRRAGEPGRICQSHEKLSEISSSLDVFYPFSVANWDSASGSGCQVQQHKSRKKVRDSCVICNPVKSGDWQVCPQSLLKDKVWSFAQLYFIHVTFIYTLYIILNVCFRVICYFTNLLFPTLWTGCFIVLVVIYFNFKKYAPQNLFNIHNVP